MPTYEYACRDCGEHLEVVQSFKDDSLTECPACQGSLRKVFSAAGIIFKGSGWHSKDYASRRSGSTSGGDGESDSSGDTASESSKDTTSKDGSSKDSAGKDSSSGSSKDSGSSGSSAASGSASGGSSSGEQAKRSA